jgi:hypothetical protein
MGIFGFLSKAHVEQTTASQENAAQIQRLSKEIQRNQEAVDRAEQKIKTLESTGTGNDAAIQAQIDREQARIDTAYARLEPAIKEQNQFIQSRTKLYTDQIQKIDQDLAQLQQFLSANEVARAQAMIGVAADGRTGPNTSRAIAAFREQNEAKKTELVKQVQQIEQDSAVKSAKAEVQRLRQQVERQVEESNKLVNRLREQIAGSSSNSNVDGLIVEQRRIISESSSTLEKLIKERYELESSNRKLEAEVGPVKYIAALIYGDNPDASVLERAVRFVTIMLVIVFDPLAIALVLAAYSSRKWDSDNAIPEKSEVEPVVNSDEQQPIQEEPMIKEDIIKPVANDEFDITKHSYLSKLKPGPTDYAVYPYSCIKCDMVLSNKGTSVASCSDDNCPIIHENQTDKQEEITIQSVEPLDTLLSTVETPPPEEPKADSTNLDAAMEIIAREIVKEEREYKTENRAQEYYFTSDNYVNYRGKIMNIDALKSMRPDLFSAVSIEPESGNNISVDFGDSFPFKSKRGNIFVKTDLIPNRVYKFDGVNWLVLDKSLSNVYLQNEDYVKFLISKLELGEIDIDLLTDDEKVAIKDVLSK